MHLRYTILDFPEPTAVSGNDPPFVSGNGRRWYQNVKRCAADFDFAAASKSGVLEQGKSDFPHRAREDGSPNRDHMRGCS